MCHLDWQISCMCKKIKLMNSMWDLHWQILTICAISEKNNSMWDLDWQIWTDCKKIEQNNSMCHLDWQISCMCKKHKQNNSITERIFQKKDTFLVEITHFISIFRSADLQQETEIDNFFLVWWLNKRNQKEEELQVNGKTKSKGDEQILFLLWIYNLKT